MWNEIIGHAQNIQQLRSVIENQQIAGTYLFVGARGIGKHKVARTFAATALCPHESAPCGTCATCARIAQGNHPDAIEVAPDPERAQAIITIEQIRHMQQQAQLHSLEGNHQFVIIDQADTMNQAAANAALKILEEPPANTHFILLSAQPDRLLTTIRSRCQSMQFAALPEQEVLQALTAQGIDPAEAKQRYLLAEGSLGRALDYPIDIFSETVRDLYQTLRDNAAHQIAATAERWAADANLLPHRLHIGCILWRDALATASNAGKASQLPATGELLNMLSSRPPRRLHRELLELLTATQHSSDTTFNKQLGCEALLFQLAS